MPVGAMILRRIKTSSIPNTELKFHSIADRAERLVVVTGVFVFVVGGVVAEGEVWIGGLSLREGDREGGGGA